jgi:hypothetical protein
MDYTTMKHSSSRCGYPVEGVYLGTTIEHRLPKPYQMKKRVFVFREKGVGQRIDLEDIVYLEARANYVDFYSPEHVFLIRTTLASALRKLPAGEFVQVHRSIAVAVRYILSVGKDSMLLSYGEKGIEVPFSKQYMPGLSKHLVLLGSGTVRKPNHKKNDEQESEDSP